MQKPRKRYLMLSKQYFRDLDSGKLVTKSEKLNPNNTYIPKYFWGSDINPQLATGFEMKDGQLINIFSNNLETNVIELYGIRIVFHDLFSADVTFYDNRKHARHTINIIGYPHFMDRKFNSKRTDTIYSDVDLTMCFDNVAKTFNVSMLNRDMFKSIGYLAQKNGEKTSKSNALSLNYGMLNNDFKIEYKGNMLEGSCYAYIFGVWAILLQDNLSFDALVTLKGYNKDKLIVDKFIYTSNVYIIKILTLWR